MQANKKPIETPTCEDLGVTVEVNQTIVSVSPVTARTAGEVVEDEGVGHIKIVEALERVKVI